jgi:hypothetical protein
MAILNLNGSPWSLTLYVDCVFFEQIDRPGDVLTPLTHETTPSPNKLSFDVPIYENT